MRGGYPRAGGGTDTQHEAPETYEGLSPRGRGNLERVFVDLEGEGAIPARAGEPRKTPEYCHRNRGYPRAGGGTTSSTVLVKASWGLSPRGRGNRALVFGQAMDDGAIPARAGEPRMAVSQSVHVRGYPRAGGGTFFL